jgi:hypothetical protein
MFEEYAEYTNQELRAMVFNLLGNRCNECGETDPLVLTLDHLYSNGSKERELIGARGIYIKAIRSKGAGYQILCANDQMRKRYYEKENTPCEDYSYRVKCLVD